MLDVTEFNRFVGMIEQCWRALLNVRSLLTFEKRMSVNYKKIKRKGIWFGYMWMCVELVVSIFNVYVFGWFPLFQ